MKKLILFILFTAVIRVYGEEYTIHLIPQPVEVHQSAGTFVLKKNTTIGFDSPEGRNVAEMLVQKLNISTGFSFTAQQKADVQILFSLSKEPVDRLGKEGYTLVADRKHVIITANSPAGLFYGMQTMLQLLPKEVESRSIVKMNWTMPAVKITDYPRFAWRGLMLDVSRNFFTKEEVKEYIDQLAQFKFNTLHLHLTDDNGWRIEIKSLPRLTKIGAWRVPRYGHFGDRANPLPGEAATVGGFYTQDDIKEIVSYAKSRFVSVLPEIDVPGHSMAAIASYPELSCTKDTATKVNPGSPFSQWFKDGTFKMLIDNTLNPSDDKVYDFLDKVFTEVAALFPFPYIHVGGDECYKGFWMKDAGCLALMKSKGMTSPEELQSYFMKKVEEILKTKGKKLIGWDEILEGGISPDATVMSWRGVKGGIQAAQTGHYVVMTPTTFAYLDYQQGEPTIEPPVYATLRCQKCYSFDPVPEGVDEKYILGGQGNLWTEQVATFRYADYMTWPRGWALAEDFWSPEDAKNWGNFVLRAEKQFQRSDIEGIRYSTAMYDAIINVRKYTRKITIEMGTEVPGVDIFYSLDDSMPDNYSLKYSGPFDLPDGPVTLRVITYRDGKPLGHLIILKPDDLKKR